jgi:hypothetical protein
MHGEGVGATEIGKRVGISGASLVPHMVFFIVIIVTAI